VTPQHPFHGCMIDTTRETLLSLAEAGTILRKHVATVYRWSTAGVRGVILETLQVGGTRCTSREAVQRFCEALTDATGPRRVRARRTAIGSLRAAEELEHHGI